MNEILPGWETVKVLGHGSFGTVYEIHRKLYDDEEEKAALKVISIPKHESDIEAMYSEGYDEESITLTFHSHLKNIMNEYMLMRKVSSANIVHCEDIRTIQHDDGIGWDIYIRMELLTPLTKRMADGMTEDAVIKLGLDICKALVMCQKYGVVHRDIKPQNIFVSENGEYKLGDFGIAKIMDESNRGTIAGTPGYMAPEVYNNQPYGSAADICSLGLVMYCLLNERRLPFAPLPPVKLNATTDTNARLRRLSGEPIPAPKNGSDELKAIVLKACAYKVEDRYASAAEMFADLKKLEPDYASIIDTLRMEEENDLPEKDGTVSVFDEVTKKGAREKTLEPANMETETDTDSVIETEPEINPAPADDDVVPDGTISLYRRTDSENKSDAPHITSLPDDSKETVVIVPQKDPVTEKTEEETSKEDKKPDVVPSAPPTPPKKPTPPPVAPTPKPRSKKKKAFLILAACLSAGIFMFVLLLALLIRGCMGIMNNTPGGDYSYTVPEYENSEPYNNYFPPVENDESEDKPVENSKEPEHVHKYSTQRLYNDIVHWRQCECGETSDEGYHEYGDWVIIVSATETSAGLKEHACRYCDYKEKETIPALEHVHSYSSSWVSNNTYHWKTCSCGATANMASHSFGSWKTVTAASCGKTGKRVRSCTACGFEESQTISATSHSYSQGTCVNCGILQSQGLSIGIETVNGRKIAVVYSIGSCKDKNIYIPAKYNGVPVTTIGHAAFRKCTFITSITIPSSVTTIENDAFTGCTGLTRAVFADTTGWYITTTEGASSGSNLSITDQSKAAEYLKTYRHYYWYKK